jgi:hypothetical protein
MNIIEYVWEYLDQRVCTCSSLPRNQEDIWAVLQEKWAQIEMEYIKNLFQSMPERVAILLKAKGGYTQY